jgi:LPS export ABC transporter protein LptC
MKTGLGLVLVAVVLPLVVGGCEEPVDTPLAPPELLELGADFVQYGMTTFLTATGVREGRVEADTAYAFTDSSKVVLQGMRLIFYDEDGRPRATVTALGGELDERTDAMIARGDVVLRVHADGRVIETSELFYDPNRDRIWSDSTTVQTLGNGQVSRGTAFESDLEFRNVRIENIRGDIGEIIF